MSKSSKKKTVVSCSDYLDTINSIFDRKCRIYNLLFQAHNQNLDDNNEIVENIKKDLADVKKEQAILMSDFEIQSIQS